MDTTDDQQFCLRWNNFQANITSQFETLRDDEDFTDVTIAVEGQRLQAHKVVLSACSPYFKELFKNNPCSHPIIFMRDVEARHVVALMEFMYAGEVNVAQAHLSGFLKTAESLKIRGLTDTSSDFSHRENDTLILNPQIPSSKSQLQSNINCNKTRKNQNLAPCNSTVTSSQDESSERKEVATPPPTKRQCKTEPELEAQQSQLEDSDLQRLKQIDEAVGVGPFVISDNQDLEDEIRKSVQPKIELPDYLSDEEVGDGRNYFHTNNDISALAGGMEIIPQSKVSNAKDLSIDTNFGSDSRKLHSLDPRPCEECGRVYSNLSNLRQHMKLIHYPTFVSCRICSKSFKTDLYLRRHMITTHESTTNFKHTNALSSNYKGKHISNCGSHIAITKAITCSNTNGSGHIVARKPNYSPLRLRSRQCDNWSPFDLRTQSCDESPDILSRLKDTREKREKEDDRRNRLVKLGEGIEIYEDQLRSVKWSDYRKLTRGLATILFSPAELATCSVTGQRWSRAGSGERPVKPALDRAKVQAIISYVATRFPMVEISRIKQVLAYKCKENSTAFKMKAVRYYGDQIREPDKN